MVENKTWSEFKDSGLLWFINTILHTFGWAIVFETEDSKITNVYPARVKFRGFSEESNTEGYTKITSYLDETSKELLKEVLPKTIDRPNIGVIGI